MGRKVLIAYERAFGDGELIVKLEGELKKAIEKIIFITGLTEDQLKENGIVQRWGSSPFTQRFFYLYD